MGCGNSVPKDSLAIGKARSPGILPDEVNRLLDRWTIGHVLIIRKRFLESKPSKSNEMDLMGFRAMFSDLHRTLPIRVVSSAFKQMDVRRAGFLTFRDICVGLATTCLSSWEVRSTFLFNWFDLDKDGTLSRGEMELFLICLVAAVQKAVRSGDWSARFPFMSPSAGTREGLVLSIEARGLSPTLPDPPERVQSCVTAVQSEVYSALEEDRRSIVNDQTIEYIPSPDEKDWITNELDSFSSDHQSISLEKFVEWSIQNSHYIYKLFELFEIVPSPAREKRACLNILKQAQMEPNSSWHVVSYKWIQLWRSYVRWSDSDSSGTAWGNLGIGSPIASMTIPMEIQQALSCADVLSCTSSVLQQRLGERPPAINNDDLEGELKGALKANLVEHHDYVLVPEAMWILLHDWYGGGPAFPRKVAARVVPIRKLSSMSMRGTGLGSSSVELYPPLIIVLICSDRGVPVKHFTKRFFVSRTDTCADLVEQLALRLVSTKPVSECRLWHRRSGEDWELIPGNDPRRIDDFVDSVTTDAGTFMLESTNARGQFPRALFVSNSNVEEDSLQVGDRVDAKIGNDLWRVATVVDITENDERIKVHFDGEGYREDAWLSFNEIAPLGSTVAVTPKNFALKKLFFASTAKKASGGAARGLENIGNTCFMNATLQCLSSTPMLKAFFLSEASKFQGRLAGEFASLLSDMWNSKKRTINPKGFKKALDKFAPRFVGYEHQDAHELLAVILDGLHEDLNRPIRATQATETSAPAGNSENLASGESMWKAHRASNASIIADLFDGQQRVQTCCKLCGNISSVFEAFRYVMVPVPVTSDQRLVTVYFVPSISSHLTPKILSVSVHRLSLFQHVVSALSVAYKKFSIDWDSSTLVAAEVYLSRLHRFIDPSTPISEFRSDDQIFLFQTMAGDDSKIIADGSIGGVIGSPVGGPPRNRPLDDSVTEVCAQIVHRREVVVRKQRRTVTRREIFGTPSVIALNSNWTYGQLHNAVKSFVSKHHGSNYVVRITSPDGSTCSACGKLNCEGCMVFPNSAKRIKASGNWIFLAIDWSSPEVYKDLSFDEPSHPGSFGDTKTASLAGSAVTLYDCLDAYIAREQLVGDNQWYCERCKAKRDAERFTSWLIGPDVLVVLLKRFQYTAAGFEKLNVGIDFPISDLTIKVGPNGDKHGYDLYGIVNHTGSLSSGHYTAICKDESSQQWTMFNDHRVIPINGPDALRREIADCAKSCYVLFYKRQDSRAANVINYG